MVLVVFPLFSGNMLNGLVRGVIGLSFASVLYPHVAAALPPQGLPMWAWGAILAKESFIGLLIGFVASLFFWAIQNVGSLIDFQTGASSATVFDPISGHEGGPSAGFLAQLAAVLFVAGGGLTILLGVIYSSYQVWPIFSYFPKIGVALELLMLREADSLMTMTVKLAAPVILVLLVAELGLGLVNRFVPQLNVFMLAMPIKAALAILILIVMLSFLNDALHEFFVGDRAIMQLLRSVLEPP